MVMVGPRRVRTRLPEVPDAVHDQDPAAPLPHLGRGDLRRLLDVRDPEGREEAPDMR